MKPGPTKYLSADIRLFFYSVATDCCSSASFNSTHTHTLRRHALTESISTKLSYARPRLIQSRHSLQVKNAERSNASNVTTTKNSTGYRLQCTVPDAPHLAIVSNLVNYGTPCYKKSHLTGFMYMYMIYEYDRLAYVRLIVRSKAQRKVQADVASTMQKRQNHRSSCRLVW